MSLQTAFILVTLAGLAGVGFGYFLRLIISLGKRGSMELEIRKMMLDADTKAKRILEEAEAKGQERAQEQLGEYKERERELKTTEERLLRREELLDNRQVNLDSEAENLNKKMEEVQQGKEQTEVLLRERQTELEKISELNAEKANEILTTAVHRLGNSVVADVLATTVTLPNDEIKGKIIGKEGRNIRTFERATGVDVIIDDTPGTITLSCFDPIRRQIAR